jgi:hypothetical protein
MGLQIQKKCAFKNFTSQWSSIEVLFKSDTKIPFDTRNDFIRISIYPDMSSMDFFHKIYELLET